MKSIYAVLFVLTLLSLVQNGHPAPLKDVEVKNSSEGCRTFHGGACGYYRYGDEIDKSREVGEEGGKTEVREKKDFAKMYKIHVGTQSVQGEENQKLIDRLLDDIFKAYFVKEELKEYDNEIIDVMGRIMKKS